MMSTNMWSNRETVIAFNHLSEELHPYTRYGVDELVSIFKSVIVDGYTTDTTYFLNDIVQAYICRVNWEELSEHHNAEHSTWITNMKFSDELIGALDSEDINRTKTWEEYVSHVKIPSERLNYLKADNTELLNDFKQSLKDAEEE